MNLFLDDQKEPKLYNIDPSTVVVARSIKAARHYLSKNKEKLNTLYLDHDLGSRDSGYDFLEDLISRGNIPVQVVVISLNYAGRKRIEALCKENNIPVIMRGYPNVPIIGESHEDLAQESKGYL
jgi:hypothetical protein